MGLKYDVWPLAINAGAYEREFMGKRAVIMTDDQLVEFARAVIYAHHREVMKTLHNFEGDPHD